MSGDIILFDLSQYGHVGDHQKKYPYYWRVRSRLPERFEQACRVLVRGKMNSCLVEFPDGYKVVTSRNYVRKWKDG